MFQAQAEFQMCPKHNETLEFICQQDVCTDPILCKECIKEHKCASKPTDLKQFLDSIRAQLKTPKFANFQALESKIKHHIQQFVKAIKIQLKNKVEEYFRRCSAKMCPELASLDVLSQSRFMLLQPIKSVLKLGDLVSSSGYSIPLESSTIRIARYFNKNPQQYEDFCSDSNPRIQQLQDNLKRLEQKVIEVTDQLFSSPFNKSLDFSMTVSNGVHQIQELKPSPMPHLIHEPQFDDFQFNPDDGFKRNKVKLDQFLQFQGHYQFRQLKSQITDMCLLKEQYLVTTEESGQINEFDFGKDFQDPCKMKFVACINSQPNHSQFVIPFSSGSDIQSSKSIKFISSQNIQSFVETRDYIAIAYQKTFNYNDMNYIEILAVSSQNIYKSARKIQEQNKITGLLQVDYLLVYHQFDNYICWANEVGVIGVFNLMEQTQKTANIYPGYITAIRFIEMIRQVCLIGVEGILKLVHVILTINEGSIEEQRQRDLKGPLLCLEINSKQQIIVGTHNQGILILSPHSLDTIETIKLDNPVLRIACYHDQIFFLEQDSGQIKLKAKYRQNDETLEYTTHANEKQIGNYLKVIRDYIVTNNENNGINVYSIT